MTRAARIEGITEVVVLLIMGVMAAGRAHDAAVGVQGDGLQLGEDTPV